VKRVVSAKLRVKKDEPQNKGAEAARERTILGILIMQLIGER